MTTEQWTDILTIADEGMRVLYVLAMLVALLIGVLLGVVYALRDV